MTEILEKLKAIESFAAKVTETKKLADDLALNFARMKETINKALNDAFREIADQIETLRRNMELMESMQATSQSGETSPPAAKVAPSQPSSPPAAPEAPAVPEPQPAKPEAQPEAVTEAPAEPAPKAVAEPAPQTATEAPTPPKEVAPPAVEKSPELEVLEQKKEKLKAALTDLRFDYMRGYIPEDEYKQKEAELDHQLEEIDKQIAALK